MIEPSKKQNSIPCKDRWQHRAMELIDSQRTLVLSTSYQNRPWAAPVYYVYKTPAFFFFSSPHSKHVEQALKNSVTSAALFSDADQWEHIEGIQMVGRINSVRKKLELLKVTTSYVYKFPMARNLLTGKEETGPDLSAKVRLYAFFPDRIFYMNNQIGFGERRELKLV